MSTTLPSPAIVTARKPSKRTILMCRPDFFTVSYRINPWMHPDS
ncbi:MAG: N-Dimethylarginine dimethylaminohydrolase, partial [Microbacteriaceae bacterium]|nr:N-Dimethylarginine dimethylaminohydrolase [Microbacteriaceae bacterium]